MFREKILNMKYQDLSLTVEKELTLLLQKITHHLHPEIVKYIIEKNLEFKEEFANGCHRLLNVDDYFYENSDCVFPGVRRNINKEGIGEKKAWFNRVNEIDGTILNDNTYPRHIWTFLLLGKAYNGQSWKQSGLNAFELAHVFGHKVKGRGLERKMFKTFDESIKPYALFTSASNVVLIPKGFAKPTDSMENVKICFYKRHLELYGNNLNGATDFKENRVPEWYNKDLWLEPVLPNDWKEKIDNLLKYRSKHLLKTKYGKYVNV